MDKKATTVEALSVDYAQHDRKIRHDLEGEIRTALQKKEDAAREELVEREAQLFIDRFPEMLQLALLERVHLENDPVGDCEEPGWRQHYLAKSRGWFRIYKYGSAFGNRNSAEFKTPLWLKKALAKLEALGWECKLQNETFSDFGVGNRIAAYLCVRDPRFPEEEIKK